MKILRCHRFFFSEADKLDGNVWFLADGQHPLIVPSILVNNQACQQGNFENSLAWTRAFGCGGINCQQGLMGASGRLRFDNAANLLAQPWVVLVLQTAGCINHENVNILWNSLLPSRQRQRWLGLTFQVRSQQAHQPGGPTQPTGPLLLLGRYQLPPA